MKQQRGIDLQAAIVLHEAVEARVIPLDADLPMNLLAKRGKPVAEVLADLASLCAVLEEAIDRDPRHHLGIDVVLLFAARFPDAVAGLLPDLLQMLDDRPLDGL